VKGHLSDAFPGVSFVYEAVEPPGVAEARTRMPLLLRLWLPILGEKTRYPNYHGYFERDTGGIVEFYFEDQDPVRWIRATVVRKDGWSARQLWPIILGDRLGGRVSALLTSQISD